MNDTAASSIPHRPIAWPAWAWLSFIYFVSVEALHLCGYWSRFGVNVLGYAAVTDLAALLIYPAAGSLLACLAGLAIGQLLGHHATSPLDDAHEPAMSRMVDTILLALWWALVGLILYFAPPVKWWGVPILIALPLARALRHQPDMRLLMPADHTRMAMLTLLCALPFYAYGAGTLAAHHVLSGTRYTVAEIPPDSAVARSARMRGLTRYKYVGAMSQYVFLMPMEDRAVIVARLDSVQPLILKPVVKTDANGTAAKPADPAPAIPPAPKVTPAATANDTPAKNRNPQAPARKQ
jgi:hypothetical protein